MDDRGISSEILKKQFGTYWPELNKKPSNLPLLKASSYADLLLKEEQKRREKLAQLQERLNKKMSEVRKRKSENGEGKT